jgi:trimeric autotransporter adhesin
MSMPRRRASTRLATAVLLALGAPVHAANSGAWALDGNTAVPFGAFLGYADPASRATLELRAANQPVVRYLPSADNSSGTPITYTTIVGALSNSYKAGVRGATIAGGGANGEGVPLAGGNGVGDNYAAVGGGAGNRAGDFAGTTSDAAYATIAGGLGNNAQGLYSSIGGGYANLARDNGATVAGGHGNAATGAASAIAGGLGNRAPGDYAAVAGGNSNCAGADFSFAFGTNAKVRPALDPGAGTACSGLTYPGGNGDVGSLVWADSEPVDFASSGPNQFLLRAQGGVGINTAPLNHTVELTVQTDRDGVGDYASLWLKQKSGSNNGVLISVGDGTGSNNAGFYLDHYNGTTQARRAEFAPSGAVTIRSNVTQGASGVTLAANSGAWSSLSDRRLKTALQAVDAGAILDKLAALPLNTWSYVAQGTGVRHIGPMAQDFAAAFAVGENDTTISTIDADGVALAAIQGLNAKLERENAALHEALAALQARLVRLEAKQER